MGQSVTLTGSLIVLYINNEIYSEVQSVSFSVNYNETPQFGIDSPYPQEIATTRIDVSGSIQGIRTKFSGGLQAGNLRPSYRGIANSPYINIRITDRSTGEDILYIPRAKVSRESHQASTKGAYRLSFDFIGQIPLFALDRQDP